jgi:DNA-binding NarL/FixJ family response regulator
MLGSERSALLEASSMEAVLTPTGQCLEARRNATSRTAREELREMARAVDRARGKLRRSDPDEALALWRGLVSGRWSLVDHFDSDGRRFVVALRNDPTVTDPRALTLRERQVAYFASLGYTNKLIAYALGVSSASVSLHLKEAAHKLRVTSRTDLAAFFAPFEGDEASVLPTTRLSE